jgi:sec-independent protein translocase protein TatC
VTLPSIQSYLSFVTLTLLAFGIAFLFPVIVLFLNFVGLFPSARCAPGGAGMIVGIAVASAVLTPVAGPRSPSWRWRCRSTAVRGLHRRGARARAGDPPAACRGAGRAGPRAARDDETSVIDDRPSPL